MRYSFAFSVSRWVICCILLAQGTVAYAQTDSTSTATDAQYRYYWPGSCLEAIERTNDLHWRARPDTAKFDPARDTMLVSSAHVARDCVAKFSIAQVKPEHLVLLARVYLAVGDDSAAHAAINRRITADASKPVSVRAATLAEIVRAYLNASPARVTDALATLRQLETLSAPEAAVGKVAAYQALAMHYVKVDDDSHAVAVSESLIAAGKQLNPHDRKEFSRSLLRGYAIIADIAGNRTGTPDAPSAVLTRAQEDIGALDPVEEPLGALMATYRLYGREGGQLTGNFWFRGAPVGGATQSGGTTTSGTTTSGSQADSSTPTLDTLPAASITRPTRGKISIVSFQPDRRNVPAFRRLQEWFGEELELIFVLRTNGYFRDQGPLTPPQEAAILHQYYIGELHLPGVMVISVTDAQALPDGRLVKGKTENVLMYGAGGKGSPGTLVLDRNGVIRRVFSGWTPWTERELEQTVQKLRTP